MLERLLRTLALQQTAGLFEFSAVVVDNDVAGSAQETVTQVREELGLQIDYGIEPVRAIAAARNHALRLAHGNYIAIIDDDEFPSETWLLTMYRAIQSYDVDGVLGPVHPFFEQTPPRWLLRSGFCERPVLPTGAILRWDQTRTGNVLIKRDVFKELSFDTNLRTGGSDREFFKHAIRAGYRFAAVEEAPVYEVVPPERWTRSYYLKRALVNGSNAYRNGKEDLRGFSCFIIPAKSAGASLVYALAVPFCLCLGNHALMNCLVRGGHHLSRLCAMVGVELVKQRDF
jgi:succinoglycan biosynthesis protein ExoM